MADSDNNSPPDGFMSPEEQRQELQRQLSELYQQQQQQRQDYTPQQLQPEMQQAQHRMPILSDAFEPTPVDTRLYNLTHQQQHNQQQQQQQQRQRQRLSPKPSLQQLQQQQQSLHDQLHLQQQQHQLSEPPPPPLHPLARSHGTEPAAKRPRMTTTSFPSASSASSASASLSNHYPANETLAAWALQLSSSQAALHTADRLLPSSMHTSSFAQSLPQRLVQPQLAQHLQPQAPRPQQQQQQQQHQQPHVQQSPAQPQAQGPALSFEGDRIIPLVHGDENEFLSDYQCLLRQQICYTIADQRLFNSGVAQGRSQAIVQGQVGIACRYCLRQPVRHRQAGSVYYPSTVSRIYQAAQNMATKHFLTHCRSIPIPIRDALSQLKTKKGGRRSGAAKVYWVASAEGAGLVERDQRLFYRPTGGA